MLAFNVLEENFTSVGDDIGIGYNRNNIDKNNENLLQKRYGIKDLKMEEKKN